MKKIMTEGCLHYIENRINLFYFGIFWSINVRQVDGIELYVCEHKIAI